MTIMTTPRDAGDRDSGLEDGDVLVELVSVEVGPTGVHGPTWRWTFAALDLDGNRQRDPAGYDITFSVLSSQKLTRGELPSKAIGWVTALLGDGAAYMLAEELDAALPGSRAIATIHHDPNGWPRITSMRGFTE